MEFGGEHHVPAPPDEVWRALNDPEVLRRSIPGCDALERTGEREFTATVTARVGPVSAPFKGKVEIVDPDPPRSYTLRGRGQGGAAGFARGEARITLTPDDGGTHLSYAAGAEIGGKLASVGGRLIQSVARKTADDFFARFSRIVSGEEPGAPEEGAPARRLFRGGPRAAAVGAEHIPLVDRIAWLIVGIGIGAVATLWLT